MSCPRLAIQRNPPGLLLDMPPECTSVLKGGSSTIVGTAWNIVSYIKWFDKLYENYSGAQISWLNIERLSLSNKATVQSYGLCWQLIKSTDLSLISEKQETNSTLFSYLCWDLIVYNVHRLVVPTSFLRERILFDRKTIRINVCNLILVQWSGVLTKHFKNNYLSCVENVYLTTS